MSYDEPYERFKSLFESTLEKDAALYNEYHALLVMAGKTYCRPNKPLCEACPLGGA
jgi:endonuclease-3 related protein